MEGSGDTHKYKIDCFGCISKMHATYTCLYICVALVDAESQSKDLYLCTFAFEYLHFSLVATCNVKSGIWTHYLYSDFDI